MLSKFKKSFFSIKISLSFCFTAMEIETIEKLLQSLELESHTNLFKQNELGLELLMSLSESELKEALTELQLPLGNRLLIIKKIQEIKAGGRFTLFRKILVWDFFFKLQRFDWTHNYHILRKMRKNCLVCYNMP